MTEISRPESSEMQGPLPANSGLGFWPPGYFLVQAFRKEGSPHFTNSHVMLQLLAAMCEAAGIYDGLFLAEA